MSSRILESYHAKNGVIFIFQVSQLQSQSVESLFKMKRALKSLSIPVPEGSILDDRRADTKKPGRHLFPGLLQTLPTDFEIPQLNNLVEDSLHMSLAVATCKKDEL